MTRSAKELKMERIQETLHYAKLPSGLEVFILPKKGYSKQFAIFATNFGSIDSRFRAPGETDVTEVPDGIAHFLEHKLFEEEEGNVFDKFSRLGASANAYTNFTNTAYLFSTTSNFYQCLEVLVDFVQRPYFTHENVEKEKGIIAQEIKMYEDNAEWKAFFNLLQGLYQVHPVRKDIAGTVESISEINKDILYKCYNTFYHPDNMVIFIAGDVDINRTLEIIEKGISYELKDRMMDIERFYPSEPGEINRERIEQRMAVSQPVFNIGFKDRDVGYTGERLFIKDIASSILLEMIVGKGSELYKKLYQEGLINDTFSFEFIAEKDYSYSIMGGESPDPEKVAGIIKEAVQNIKPEALTEEDFRLARNKLLGRYLKRFNSLEYIASHFVSYHFKGINFLELIDYIERVDIDYIRKRFALHIRPDNMAMSVVLPK